MKICSDTCFVSWFVRDRAHWSRATLFEVFSKIAPFGFLKHPWSLACKHCVLLISPFKSHWDWWQTWRLWLSTLTAQRERKFKRNKWRNLCNFKTSPCSWDVSHVLQYICTTLQYRVDRDLGDVGCCTSLMKRCNYCNCRFPGDSNAEDNHLQWNHGWGL